METAVHAEPASVSDALGAPRIARLRLGIGLLQGVALYLLVNTARFDDGNLLLLTPLAMVALLCPVILVSGAAALSRRQLLIWAGTAALCIVALAVYDVWRGAEAYVPDSHRSMAVFAPVLTFFTVVCLFIAHALVLSGAREGRRIASYATYFDIAWKLGVQLAFSALFVGVSWAVLALGASLFNIVDIKSFAQLITSPWFAFPFTTCAAAGALHLTDVKPAIVHGIRNLLLTMLSWVLPVLVLIVGAFLVSLLFTGVQPLWSTRFATALLLGVDAALVILINAAWQDGIRAAVVPRLIRFSVRAAALLLLPLTALAAYALALRVGDLGWTVDRVIAAACTLVASCYAFGYAKAAFGPGWLDGIARVNIINAFVALGTILLLFSPVADPARLSVDNQVARLVSGKVSAADFDFAYLYNKGERFGHAALDQLEAGNHGAETAVVRERIGKARNGESSLTPSEQPQVVSPKAIAANLKVWPAGTRLPESFLATSWKEESQNYTPACLVKAAETCDVFLLDMSGDGKPEVVIVEPLIGTSVVAQETAAGRWEIIAQGQLPGSQCDKAQREAMQSGRLRAVAPALADLELGGHHFQFRSTTGDKMGCAPGVR